MLVVSDSYTDGTLHKAVTGRGRIPDSQDLDFLNYFTVGEYIGQKYARPGRHLKHVQYDVEYSDHSSECGENWDETTREWGAHQLQQLTALAWVIVWSVSICTLLWNFLFRAAVVFTFAAFSYSGPLVRKAYRNRGPGVQAQALHRRPSRSGSSFADFPVVHAEDHEDNEDDKDVLLAPGSPFLRHSIVHLEDDEDDEDDLLVPGSPIHGARPRVRAHRPRGRVAEVADYPQDWVSGRSWADVYPSIGESTKKLGQLIYEYIIFQITFTICVTIMQTLGVHFRDAHDSFGFFPRLWENLTSPSVMFGYQGAEILTSHFHFVLSWWWSWLYGLTRLFLWVVPKTLVKQLYKFVYDVYSALLGPVVGLFKVQWELVKRDVLIPGEHVTGLHWDRNATELLQDAGEYMKVHVREGVEKVMSSAK